MAVRLQPWLLSVLLHVCFFFIPFSSCQSALSPVNIETFYPSTPPPITPNNTQIFPPTPPPVTSLPPVAPPPPAPVPVAKQDSTSSRTIAKVVAATAASTFVVSAVLFFLIRVARRRRKETVSLGTQAVVVGGGGGDGDEFRRFDGNVKGLIVDENGLDVFYWKKLGLDDQRNSGFQKSVFHGPKHGGGKKEEEEEKEVIHVGNQNIQEIPLFRGRSSTSHYKVVPEANDRYPITAPPAEIASQAIQKPRSTPPPPPLPLPPVPSKAMPPPPPPVASKSMMSVPKSQSTALPLPPPPVPVKKTTAPPPPPPKAVSSRPPIGHKALQIERMVGESSSRETGMEENGNDQVKLKPLHWDKLKPNGDHSMVWDKIDNGSFR